MSIKDDLDRMVAKEAEDLARKREAREVHRNNLMERFEPLRLVLVELKGALEEPELRISFGECNATIHFEPKHGWSAYHWEIWPEYSSFPEGAYEYRAGYSVQERHEIGFIYDDGKKFAGPDFNFKENEFVQKSERDVLEYLMKILAKEIAARTAK